VEGKAEMTGVNLSADENNVLHFPDRSLLHLVNGIDRLLAGKTSPETVLAQCDAAMQAIGAVKDVNGEWRLPEPDEPDSEPEHGEMGPRCINCGGRKTWCSHCRVWSSTCCQEYGTCQCS